MLQTSKFSTLMHTILFDTLKSNKNPFWVLRFWSCLTINIGFINKKEKKNVSVSKLICAMKIDYLRIS